MGRVYPPYKPYSIGNASQVILTMFQFSADNFTSRVACCVARVACWVDLWRCLLSLKPSAFASFPCVSLVRTFVGATAGAFVNIAVTITFDLKVGIVFTTFIVAPDHTKFVLHLPHWN